jgi:hypothetical protein
VSMWGGIPGRNAKPDPDQEYVDLVAHPELEPDLGPTKESIEQGAEPDDAWHGPRPPAIGDLWAAQGAPHDANVSGCSDEEYDRLVLEKQQTELAYLEAHDRDFARAWDAEQEAEAGS